MNALVTGGSRGIGKAIVEQLKVEGYQVYAPTSKEMNLLDEKSIEQYFECHKDITFDVLINDAGINDINLIEDITEEDIKRTLLINLIGPIRLIKNVVRGMKKQNYGRIINIGSIWGVVGKPGRTIYASSKHGIHGLTQTLAVELASNNILINTVCPGFTLTDLTYKNNTKEQIDEISNCIPLGRMATPEEQAKIVCYLASKNNTYITGQQIVVDGGYTSK